MEYFVNYGRSGFLGRFRFDEPPTLQRGNLVVVATPRGLEMGTVLEQTTSSYGRLMAAAAAGYIVREASEADFSVQSEMSRLAAEMVMRVEQRCGELALPVVVLDAELPLDRGRLILSVLGGADEELATLGQSLSDDLNMPIDFHRPDQPADDGGCGKPGCGSKGGGCSSCGTSGGCSTGGCSRGSVKSANEMTAYFADLRKKMHDQLARVSLH